MSAKLLEGKPIAANIKEAIKKDIEALDKRPVLASIQVGDNAGANSYIKSQTKVADSLGIEYRLSKLPDVTSQDDLTKLITSLNEDQDVNGIIVQMPLPKDIDYKAISSFISPAKDVEGMHPQNLGKIVLNKANVLPCTAAAVMEILNETKIDLYGKEVVVVGHSEIVGKPLSLLLLNKFATTSVCHIGTSKAGKLATHVSNAEILIVAVGVPKLIKGEWVKDGAIVIDVGINRVDGKLVGDVEFDVACEKASQITPVPGGVGPLTTTILMRNLIEATKLQG